MAVVNFPSHKQKTTQALDTTQLHSDREQSYDGGMTSTMTREEMTARLDAQDARLEARVQRVELLGEQIKSSDAEIVSEMKSMKWWMIGTGLSVVLGIASFNATVLSNMVASFESGKTTAQSLAQTQADLEKVAKSVQETQELLRQAAKKESNK